MDGRQARPRTSGCASAPVKPDRDPVQDGIGPIRMVASVDPARGDRATLVLPGSRRDEETTPFVGQLGFDGHYLSGVERSRASGVRRNVIAAVKLGTCSHATHHCQKKTPAEAGVVCCVFSSSLRTVQLRT
jgi:hypothetical protein